MPPPELAPDRVRTLRLRAQGLGPRRSAGVTEVARRICGLQAQDPAAAALSLRARSTGLRAADVARALHDRRVVRSWFMRGTLHLIAADDHGWLHELFAPVALRAGRKRRAGLGLDPATLDRVDRLLRRFLSGGRAATREALAEAFATAGVPLEGPAFYHALRHAALTGSVVLAADAAGDPAWVLCAPGPPGPAYPDRTYPDRSAAAAALARRYLAGHGPAGADDFAVWSGLPKTEARTGWEALDDSTVEVRVDGRPARLTPEQTRWLDESPAETGPGVRLLPAYDSWWLGHRDRSWTVAPEHARRVHPGGGTLRPTLLVDGRARGTWTLRRRRDGLALTVVPFAALEPEVLPRLDAEAADVGRFLERPVTLRLEPPGGTSA